MKMVCSCESANQRMLEIIMGRAVYFDCFSVSSNMSDGFIGDNCSIAGGKSISLEAVDETVDRLQLFED